MADSNVRTLARLTRLLERGAGDLSLAQFRILAFVDDGGERASQLAERLAVGKPTVTAVVDGLVERGYLKRTADCADRRATRISLTASGRRALEQAEQAMTALVQQVLDQADDPHAVRHALVDLGDALDRARQQRMAARR